MALPIPPPRPGRSGWPWQPEEIEDPAQGEQLPRISVITPSFNQGRFLEETIRSVLLQGYPNLEYIVVDGGSTDESLAVIGKYERWLDGWICEPDEGQADAVNKGFALATGDILAWVNSDDLLWPGHLLAVGRLFAREPEADLVYRDAAIGADPARVDRVLQGRVTSFLEMVRTLEVPIPQQTAAWRRQLFERLGGLDTRWHVLLDRDFFLRAGEVGCLRYLPGIGGFFRQHALAKSTAGVGVWERELPRYYREFFARRSAHEEVRKRRREAMARVFLTCFHIARRVQRPARALGWILRAGVVHPRVVSTQLVALVARGRSASTLD